MTKSLSNRDSRLSRVRSVRKSLKTKGQLHPLAMGQLCEVLPLVTAAIAITSGAAPSLLTLDQRETFPLVISHRAGESLRFQEPRSKRRNMSPYSTRNLNKLYQKRYFRDFQNLSAPYSKFMCRNLNSNIPIYLEIGLLGGN